MEESYSEQILIVEDEPGIAGMISSILQANEYTVLKAGTGTNSSGQTRAMYHSWLQEGGEVNVPQ